MTASSTAKENQLRDRLTQTYRRLPKIEQTILQLYSVAYEPMTRTSCLECLNELGKQDEQGKPFVTKTLKPHIDHLIDVELLRSDPGKSPQCHPLVVEIVTRDTVRNGSFESLVQVIEVKLPIGLRWDKARQFKDERQLLREVRIGIYRQDMDFIQRQFSDYTKFCYGERKDKSFQNRCCQKIYNNPFDPDWFCALPSELYENALWEMITQSVLTLSPTDEPFSILVKGCSESGGQCSDKLRSLLIEQYLLRGEIDAAQQQLEHLKVNRDDAAAFHGWLAFLKGDVEGAISHYTEALKVIKKTTSKRKVYFETISGVFFILALLKEGSAARLVEAENYASIIANQSQYKLRSIYTKLLSLLQFQQGNLAQKAIVVSGCLSNNSPSHGIEPLLNYLCLFWIEPDTAKANASKVLKFRKQAQASSYHWLAQEAAELLSRLQPTDEKKSSPSHWRQERGITTIVDTVEPKEAWMLCLNALANFTQDLPSQNATHSEAKQRLVWIISHHGHHYQIQPKEQSLSVKGMWSQGRVISLKRLSKNLNDFDYLTPQDRQVCARLQVDHGYDYYGRPDYYFDESAIAALVGHPLVFWENSPTVRVEIVKGEPELLVKQGKGNQLTLEFSPSLKGYTNLVILKESPTRLKVIEVNAQHQRIASILGQENRLEVPATAQEQVLAAIQAISSIVTVHSDIGGGVAAQEVPTQSQPHVHLLPAGNGLKVAILCRPFAPNGSYFQPGRGGKTVITEIDGQRLQTTRSLREEKQLAQAVINACPTLKKLKAEDGEWFIADPEECLEFLLELQELKELAIVEWPEGEKIRVSSPRNFDHLHLKIERQRDWFAAEGELALDDNLVLDLQHLLELLDQTPGRFIPLAEGQYLALTREFRQRLDELRTFSEQQGKGRRFHPLAALALEDVLNEVGTTGQDWQTHIQRLKEMQTLEPEIPATLQVDLRDYQVEGFRWLARLAQWEMGLA